MPPVTATNPVPAQQNPVVYLDVNVGQEPMGRIMIELYADVCPKTVENFRNLCTGEACGSNGRLQYKSVPFHAVYPDWAIVGGDITNKNGTSGESIYGEYFEDENFQIKHDKPGVVSMMNFKNDTNASQFIISLCPAPSLDGQNVAFGQVISGFGVLEKVAQYGSLSGETKLRVEVAECGQMPTTYEHVRRISIAA